MGKMGFNPCHPVIRDSGRKKNNETLKIWGYIFPLSQAGAWERDGNPSKNTIFLRRTFLDFCNIKD